MHSEVSNAIKGLCITSLNIANCLFRLYYFAFKESAILGVVILTLVSVSSHGHNVIHTAEKRAGIPADGVWFGSLGDHVAAFALQGRRKYMEDR